VVRVEKLELLTYLKVAAPPAAGKFFLFRAQPDFAGRVGAAVPACPVASHFDHGTKYLVAIAILFEFLEKRIFRQNLGRFFESVGPEFLAQVAREIRDHPGMIGAVPAGEAAIGNILEIHEIRILSMARTTRPLSAA
jgi:hypothetical protein